MTTAKRAATEIAVFALFVVLTVALTWPLGRGMSRFTSDAGDPLLVTALIDWDCWAITHAPLRIYDAPFYVPGKSPLAYSENFIGEAILVLPFWLAGLAPITVYNIAMILAFALSGYGAYVLARTCGTSFVAALAAGVFFAFTPYKFDHLSHLQIVASGWLALMFAACIAYWKTPSTLRAGLLAAAFVMNGLTNIHYLLFGGLTLLLTIGFLSMVDRRRDRRFWMTLAIALSAATLILIPFLLPYRIVSQLYGMHRGVEETMAGSAVPRDWLIASDRSRWYGRITARAFRHAERQIFPGLVAIILGAVAFLTRRRESAFASSELPPLTSRRQRIIRWLDGIAIVCAVMAYFAMVTDKIHVTVLNREVLSFSTAAVPLMIITIAMIWRSSIRLPRVLSRGEDATLTTKVQRSRFTLSESAAAVWILVGVLGSFGLNAFFYQFLYRFVPVFQSVRTPARWSVVAYAGLAVWMAMGIDEILRRLRRRPALIGSLFVALAAVEAIPIIRWESVLTATPPVYQWLKERDERGPILGLPMSGNNIEYYDMLWWASHHIPMINGISGFAPPISVQLDTAGQRDEFDDNYTALLERIGCRIIIVNGDYLRFHRDPIFRWLRRNLATGRIAFLRRFEHGSNGDWVFAMTRNVPEWRSFRAPEVPDAAGHTPSQNLARFLSAQHVYNASTFAYVDSPKGWTEVRGPLSVSGWALSSHDIERVIVHFDNDRRQFDAELFPRPDIGHAFLDYYPSQRAGFRFILPRRPKGVHLETNFQIEVIDGSGKSTWLSDTPVWWYR